ncbi:MAG: galactokinase [Oscillospiraceae bacterium]|nr:galactokinase [Oscillospiraceae bacterium]
MNTNGLKQALYNEKYIKMFAKLYGDKAKNAPERYKALIDGFVENFGDSDSLRLFSAPGRTEIGGNHTDHQQGNVLAASVDLDIIAACAENGTNTIRIKSQGFECDVIDLDDLGVHEDEINTSAALIRGIAAKFVQMGCKVRGFDAYTTSNVLKGSGLSSSAAFEVLVGQIINAMFFENSLSAPIIAQIGQYAENVYFGKPCGLMDQMACAVGGVIAIDFYDKGNPQIHKMQVDLSYVGYALCIIDSGADHVDLTDEYAAITGEMKSVASVFGQEVLSRCSKTEVIKNSAEIRKKCGDRAFLRAMHFFDDNERVKEQVDIIEHGLFDDFLKKVKESGYSSFMNLQNVYSTKDSKMQAVACVLAICADYLKESGAYRVHGGGFAGTVQAFVPLDLLHEFENIMEDTLGKNMCHVLNIRPVGVTEL